MRKKIPPLLIMALAILIMAPGPAYPKPDKTGGREGSVLTFAVIPFYGPEKIWKLYTPFVNYLNKTTRHRWELKLFHNHEDVIAGLCSGEISIAMLGPVPLGRAAKHCGVEPLVVALGSDGRPFYRAVILTAQNGVKDLIWLKGKRFGVFQGSTAAHILPLKMLQDAGVAQKDITLVFYPNQEDIIRAVMTSKVAAGGVKESLYLKFKDAPLKVLKTSDPVHGFAFSAARSIGPEARQAFINALLELKPREKAEHQRIVKDWDDEIKNGFVLPPESFLDDVLKLNKVYEDIMHEDR